MKESSKDASATATNLEQPVSNKDGSLTPTESSVPPDAPLNWVPALRTLNKQDSTVSAVESTARNAAVAAKSAPSSASTSPSKPALSKRVASSKPAIPAIAEITNEQWGKRIQLGICAMDKKARSKPMAEILSRLDETLFHVVFFGDDVILNKDVEEWPKVDVLIAFYSSGYPLEKAQRYVDLHEDTKPFVLNDLEMQNTLKDRRKVYDLLEASGIDVPRHAYLSRDGYTSSGTGAGNGNHESDLIEHDDHIEINGIVVHKPFVEKPVDADDHNIAIYYPASAGGGCKKLFRKIGDRSSEFYPDINEVRRDGSYIYEEFVETQGTDVKMYTVGPDYGHAEARKSPTVDGKVERNPDGKEVRFPVILTFREKEIARRIVLGFKQWVCGFDLLRVQEGDSLVSYVCDVNGWSFVKNSRKYYDDCAQILTEHMLAAVKPKALTCYSTLQPLMVMEDPGTPPEAPPKKTTRALLRVTRMLGIDAGKEAEEKPATSPSHEENETVENEADTTTAPVSAATTLEEGAIPVREIPDKLTQEPASMANSMHSSVNGDEHRPGRMRSYVDPHQEELRCVIAIVRHGDRTPKQKLKVNISEPHILDYYHTHTSGCRKDLKVKAKKPMLEFLQKIRTMIKEKEQDKSNVDKEMLSKLKHMRDVMERWKIVGLNRKLQIKPKQWEEFVNDKGDAGIRCTKVQLIFKWGGNLTKLGEKQSINLGQRLRHDLYPDSTGGGILRLHSTFRHDLKIKTSDEGRVMKTAAACAKGLLELEGEIPPILVSLVHKEKDSIHMLDPSGNKEVKLELEQCKQKINVNLQKDTDISEATEEEAEAIVGPTAMTSLHNALRQVGNPRRRLFKIRGLMGELIDQLEDMLNMMGSGDESRIEGGEGLKGDDENDTALSGVKLYKGETLLELTERWRFLYRRLYDEETEEFDLSRVPDVHDNVRFDMLHNPHLGLTSTLEKLYESAKIMADCVVPQEYGSSIEEKRSIGSKMCRALLEKLNYDLTVAKTDEFVDMRYMINMDYSADLPINTMGRRVRTRLYFTSESHLHTLLNVLRFGASDDSNSVLSQRGLALVNDAPELCYLTQIIIRLFEDPRRDSDDPRRFRVELMFSPGATGTPMHMSELVRDLDSTRFDTSGLEMIGKDGLTCQEIVESFDESIQAGKTEGDDVDDTPTADLNDDSKLKQTAGKENHSSPSSQPPKAPAPKTVAKEDNVERKPAVRELKTIDTPELGLLSRKLPDASSKVKEDGGIKKSALRGKEEDGKRDVLDKNVSWSTSGVALSQNGSDDSPSEHPVKIESKVREIDNDNKEPEEEENDDERIERMARLLARQYFWRSVAFVSFFAGLGCLFLARNVGESPRYARRGTRR